MPAQDNTKHHTKCHIELLNEDLHSLPFLSPPMCVILYCPGVQTLRITENARQRFQTELDLTWFIRSRCQKPYSWCSGRFVKQVQSERRQAKRNLVPGSKHRLASPPRTDFVCPCRESVREGVAWKYWAWLCEILESGAFLAGKWFAMPSIMRSWTL